MIAVWSVEEREAIRAEFTALLDSPSLSWRIAAAKALRLCDVLEAVETQNAELRAENERWRGLVPSALHPQERK